MDLRIAVIVCGLSLAAVACHVYAGGEPVAEQMTYVLHGRVLDAGDNGLPAVRVELTLAKEVTLQAKGSIKSKLEYV